MLSLALVLQIQFQNFEFPSIGGVQPNFFWLAFLSPYAGLYLISFPGLWSTVKRSTKAKIKRKTYVSPGENAASAADGDDSEDAKKGKSLREEAGEIMACK